jgi:hypothetical protein
MDPVPAGCTVDVVWPHLKPGHMSVLDDFAVKELWARHLIHLKTDLESKEGIQTLHTGGDRKRYLRTEPSKMSDPQLRATLKAAKR